MDSVEALRAEVEAFLARHHVAATAFGRAAVNDGKFVFRLRSGTDMLASTMARVRAYMASVESKAA